MLMLRPCRRGWWLSHLAIAVVAVTSSVVGASPALAQTSPQVVQVEEDWELVIQNPDSGNVAPQVTCTISPNLQLNTLYATFELNHKTVPEFAAGGVHLQLWSNDYNLSRKSHSSAAVLATANEVVSWTSRMQLQGNALTFAIVNGHSTTWGDFGGGTTLTASYGTSLKNLNAYSCQKSVENSGIGYASNRVTSLALKCVRYTLDDGAVLTDDAPRVVHELGR